MGKYDPAPTVAAGLIRSARDRAGMTQGDLAEAADVTQQSVSAYETGRREPTLPTLMRLIEAAGLEMRIRLVPAEGHDESLESFTRSLPVKRRAEIERDLVDRAEAARLRRVRGG